jgi:glycosyltransferase involved in cell wall biosynthesis
MKIWEEAKTKKLFAKIRCNSPTNVYFHKPVFEEEKFDVLVNASLYIQTSRWEGFPVSIVEAMSMGVPCAVTEMPNLAELFRQHDLGLLLAANPQESANRLRKALSQPDVLQAWSKRAEEFALQNFRPSEVASNYLNVYPKVINN